MKIIHIGYYPHNINYISGGIESAMWGMAQGLSSRNEVIVLCLPLYLINDQTRLDKKVKVFFKKNYFKCDILGMSRIVEYGKLILREKPHICHFHGSSVYVLFLSIFCKMLNIKTVVTIHGILTRETKNDFIKRKRIETLTKYFFYSRIEWLILLINQNILVNTNYVKEVVSGLIHIKKNIHIVPQGVDTAYFSRQLKPKPKYLTTIGAISPRKGILYLLKSLEILKNYDTNYFLNIIGGVKDHIYFDLLKDYAKQNNLLNNVFFWGNIDNEKLRDVLSSTEIFLLHSEEESQGMVLCEAMAMGIPIVATKIGGISDVVEDGENGYLVSFSDYKYFANKIKEISEDTNLSEYMSNKNILKANMYSWDQISNKIEEIYFNILTSQHL